VAGFLRPAAGSPPARRLGTHRLAGDGGEQLALVGAEVVTVHHLPARVGEILCAILSTAGVQEIELARVGIVEDEGMERAQARERGTIAGLAYREWDIEVEAARLRQVGGALDLGFRDLERLEPPPALARKLIALDEPVAGYLSPHVSEVEEASAGKQVELSQHLAGARKQRASHAFVERGERCPAAPWPSSWLR